MPKHVVIYFANKYHHLAYNYSCFVTEINSPLGIMIYCNIIILWGPPSYMRSVVDRNVVMRRIPVLQNTYV